MTGKTTNPMFGVKTDEEYTAQVVTVTLPEAAITEGTKLTSECFVNVVMMSNVKLRMSLTGLEWDGEEPIVPETDKTKLAEKLDAAKAVEQGYASEELWNTLQDAIQTAEAVLSAEESTQDEIDAQLPLLDAAMKAVLDAEAPEKPEVNPGWTQNGNIWGYVKEDGTPAKAEFLKIGVNTFYFDENGVMATGWKEVEGTWYYFYNSGRMLTGWQKIGANWFYFEADGAMVTGWKAIGTKWYYFYDSGRMLTGWQKIDGYWYYLKSSGEMTKGWLNDGGKWFYFDGSGHMATGWKAVGTKWYYFFDSGRMATGWLQEGGNWYYLKSSGEMTKGWAKIGANTFYFDGSGHMATGTKVINGTTYRFKSNGALIK